MPAVLPPDIYDRQIWVFGLAEARPFGKRKMFFVANRDHETLGAIIRDHVSPGAHIDNDGWLGYNSIPWEELGLTHTRHVHLQGNRRTMANSEYIEGLWH